MSSLNVQRWSALALLVVLSAFASSCSSLRYYAHVTHGQMQIMAARKPLDSMITAPTADAQLTKRLTLARDARRFASQHLGLPDNRSYTTYADLKRPYVVWNVFAAPRYSVDAVLHCFPIAGCVPYRGYFDEARAQTEGARLREEGDDVYVGGVAAYSTLGWFADPILSTMLRWDDDELADTIFHELAHQLIYVKDDTAFNESFASFVGDQGLREWRAARGLPPPDERRHQTDDDFIRLVLDLRERLRKLYADANAMEKNHARVATANADRANQNTDAILDAAKEKEIADFRTRYAQWRDAHWPDDHRYDAFVAKPINNATLLPFGLYDQWMPAFVELFKQSNGDWNAFYQRARELARLSKSDREKILKRLLGPSAKDVIEG